MHVERRSLEDVVPRPHRERAAFVSVLTPAPGGASAARMVRAQALLETRLLLRNGEQLVLAVVVPLLVLVGVAEAGARVDLGAGRRIDVLTPGVLALAVLSTAFTSVAIATGFERRYGVLKRLGASPLPRSGLLLARWEPFCWSRRSNWR
jgi:ABC-2 type transport system permease protein